MGKTRVLVIGLDGATFDLIRPWAEGGKLPNLAKIMKNGVSAVLRSTIPPVTAPAWTSFITGKNPGKHGVFDFFRKIVGSYERRANTSMDVDGKSIWALLSNVGKKVIVINVPMTYPAEQVNGYLISGLLAPPGAHWREGAFYPSGFDSKLSQWVGDYRLEPKESWGENLDDWIKDLYDVTRKRAKAAMYLAKNFEWDFFMVLFQGTDWMAHALWMYADAKHPLYDPEKAKKYGDAIFRFYQEIDSIVGRIRSFLDENVILFLVSDHGMGPLYRTVHLNSLLENLGLLAFQKSSLKSPVRIEFWLSKIGLTKERILALLWEYPPIMRLIRLVLYSFGEKVELSLSDLDWSKTKVYAAGHMGQLFINLKGREPKGIVEPGKEYEELRDYLMKMLYNLKDPETGKRIVRKVFRKEEIYKGDHVDEAPDLLYLMNHTYVPYNGFESSRDSFISLCYGIQSSKHELNGIFIATGKDIKKGIQIQNASIMDVAPTMLHILDTPIPIDMDGRTLVEIFEPESELAKREILYQAASKQKKTPYALSDEEEKEIIERLKSLGYIG